MARLSALQKAKRPAAVRARTSQASATPSSSGSALLTPIASGGVSSSPRTFSAMGKGKGGRLLRKGVEIRKTKTAKKSRRTGGGVTGLGMTGTEKKKKRKGAVTRSTLKEIAKLQRNPKLRIPKAVIRRMAREQMASPFDMGHPVRMTPSAQGVLHEAVESYIQGYLNDSNAVTHHSKRVTLMPRDLGLASQLRGR
eukprot:Hpha_TRINITY_DN10076_c0_g1::TRINITY_DN10076_c0_g1_i1::g.83982::m.83982/K11253/H3; histone H3